MSTIQPFTNRMLKSRFGQKIFSTQITKIGLCIGVGIGTMSTLGFYRGCREYWVREIKNKKTPIDLTNYLCCSVFGLIGLSIYINPSLSAFAVYHEYLLAKMFINGEHDERITENCSFFNLCEKNTN
jgi:hypothetical protein